MVGIRPCLFGMAYLQGQLLLVLGSVSKFAPEKPWWLEGGQIYYFPIGLDGNFSRGYDVVKL